MAKFSKSVTKVFELEGKYSEIYNDKGNWTSGEIGVGQLVGTNWGISAPTFKRYYGKTPTKTNMRTLTKNGALKIYKKLFWDKIKGDNIRNQEVAEIVFDAYVNQTGWTRYMIRDSLKALNKPSANIQIPLTEENVKRINKTNSKRFFEKFWYERKRRYIETSLRPGQGGFLKGWLNRLNKFSFGFGDTVIKYFKRNWIPVTISGLLIIGTAYLFFRYKTQIINELGKIISNEKNAINEPRIELA